MGVNMEYSALARLLALNNQVHDMEQRLLAAPVSRDLLPQDTPTGDPGVNGIAGMQEEIAQGVRASLAACWLGASADEEP